MKGNGGGALRLEDSKTDNSLTEIVFSCRLKPPETQQRGVYATQRMVDVGSGSVDRFLFR